MSLAITNIDNYLIVNILSMLPLKDQLNSRLVCKKWDELAEQAKNIEAILGVEIYGKLGVFPNNVPPCVPDAAKEFLKGNKCVNRLIVLIMEGMSDEKIGELFKKKFPQNKDGYQFVPSNIKNTDEFRSVVEKSYWIGITRTLIQDNNNNEQDEIDTKHDKGKQMSHLEAIQYVKNLQQISGSTIRLPKIKEITLSALLRFEQTGERLLKRDEGNFNETWCIELVTVFGKKWGTGVSNFGSTGISIYDLFHISRDGSNDLSELGLIPVQEF